MCRRKQLRKRRRTQRAANADIDSGAAMTPPEHPQAMPDIIEEVCGDVFAEAASMVSGPATLEEPSLTVSLMLNGACATAEHGEHLLHEYHAAAGQCIDHHPPRAVDTRTHPP